MPTEVYDIPKPEIRVTREFRVDDESGREVTQFIPWLIPDVQATGTLKFAIFETWSDDPQSVKDLAQNNAIQNAKRVLITWGLRFENELR